MKREFSTHWISSKRPGKQRKYVAKAPNHLRRKFLGANLSKELRKKVGKRSLPIKKGDLVRVMNGKFRGKSGKILTVITNRVLVEVEGLQVKKQDGSKVNVKLRPSNLQITELTSEGKGRFVSGNKVLKESKQDKVMEEKNAPKKTGSA